MTSRRRWRFARWWGHRALALGDRRPRLGRDAMLSPVGAYPFVREVRMDLDLIHSRHRGGFLRESVKMFRLEVRHADAARASVGGEFFENTPRRDEVAVIERWQRPVDQEQVDIVGIEQAQGSVERASCIVRLVEAVVELAGDEDTGSVQPGLEDALADFPFISIHFSGVDVPVTDVEGSLHRRGGFLWLDLEDAETKLRDVRAVVQLDCGNVAHS